LLLFFQVLIKKDFPFAKVPVPTVSYLNDTEPQVTLKCSFDFPTWGNVSFDVQWFVNAKGVKTTTICDNPNEKCNRREFELTTTDYGPGDSVSHGFKTFAPINNTHPHCKKKGLAVTFNLNSPLIYPLKLSVTPSFLFVDFFLH